MSPPPLLRAEEGRIDVDGAPLLESLSFEASGAYVALLGAWEPLFRLFTRQATLPHGGVWVNGVPAAEAVAGGALGVMPRDGALPEKGTVGELFATSARLHGLGARAARARAEEATAALGVPGFAKRALATLNPTERRAVGIAHATVTDPAVVALECPLAGVDERGAASLAVLIDRVAVGRSLVVSFDTPRAAGAEWGLLRRAASVVILAAGRVVRTGAPESVLEVNPHYVLHTLRARERLAAALEARGLGVAWPDGDAEGDAGRLLVGVPPGSGTRAIVEAALEARAPLVDLVPIGLSEGAVPPAPTDGGDGGGSSETRP